MITRCENCGAVRDEKDLIPLSETPDLGARLDPGSVIPAGECPGCGCLAYLRPTEAQSIAAARRMFASDDLEIDDRPRISDPGEDGDAGRWVNAWVWVCDDNVTQEDHEAAKEEEGPEAPGEVLVHESDDGEVDVVLSGDTSGVEVFHKRYIAPQYLRDYEGADIQTDVDGSFVLIKIGG